MKKGLCFIVCFFVMVSKNIYVSQGLLDALELASLLVPPLPVVTNPKLKALLSAPTNNFGVVYIPTLQQGVIQGWPVGELGNGLTWAQVHEGDVANCGYHALKNIIFLMNALLKDNQIFLENLTKKESFFDCMKIWAPMIYNYREHKVPINDLQGQEIDLLLNKLNDLKEVPQLSGLNFNLDIRVIEEEVALENKHGLINEALYTSFKGFSAKKDGILGVIWNVGNGHWIAFVLYKLDSLQKIFYMDSCGVCNRNCQSAVKIFTASIKKIEEIELSNQRKNLNTDIEYMQRVLFLLNNPGQEMIELILGSKDAKFIPEDAINAVFTKILINCNGDAFDKNMQETVMDVLTQILRYLSEHKDLMKKINWKVFGNPPYQKKFKGFALVMQEVLNMLTMISDEAKNRFWVEQVSPLL